MAPGFKSFILTETDQNKDQYETDESGNIIGVKSGSLEFVTDTPKRRPKWVPEDAEEGSMRVSAFIGMNELEGIQDCQFASNKFHGQR